MTIAPWSSTTAQIVIDVLIIVLITTVVLVAFSWGMFRKRASPRTGRVLVLLAAVATCIYYLVDLAALSWLPPLIGEEQAALLLHVLRDDVQQFVRFVSIVLLGAGIFLLARLRRSLEMRILRSDERVATAQREIVESEIRFRSLIEQTVDAVYCFEFRPPMSIDLPVEQQIEQSYDAVLVESNQVFADALGFAYPAMAVGTRVRDIDSAKDRESHARLMRHFIENDYRANDFELEYVDPAGNDRALLVSFTGVVQDRKLVRIWGAEVDILEQKQTKTELLQRNRFQSLMVAVSSSLVTAAEDVAGETLSRCLEQVAQFFCSDRANIVWIDLESNSTELLYYWNEHGGPPWVRLSLENFPWMGPQVLAGQSIRISTLDDMPAEAATDIAGLHTLGLKSAAVVPLVVEDQVLGALSFGNIADEAKWTDQDMTDLRVIADLFANAVVRMKTQQSLKQALAELRRAKERLEAENVYLREEISSTHGFDELVGESPQLKSCLRQVEQVAGTLTAVLIQGETGTGKELIARAIHERSARSQRALVKVNCAALPANLIESELFGHEKGAFTGAHSRKQGRFDLADGGTLFLDEIGDFPLDLQGKLLRVLQEGEFQRVGGTATIKVNVRLIAATNRNLQDAVDSGEFRADLYYRINTFPIFLPRLAARDGDIAILAEHFARKHAAQLGKDIEAISAEMIAQLNAYGWPGNVRELEGVVQRALISASGPILELPEPLVNTHRAQVDGMPRVSSMSIDLRVAERSHIERVLEQARWKIGGSRGAAAALGIPPSTLRSKMKKLGISRPNRIR